MDATSTKVYEEGMKNDLILALLGFILSALVAWMSSITIMVFNLDKAYAVREVQEQQHIEDFLELKEEALKAL